MADTFTTHVTDMFEQLHLGPVRVRRMFGGAGVYLGEDPMLGLIIDGVLYLRADEDTRQDFVDAGTEPFTYTKKNGVTATMQYWQLPESSLDDPRELRDWVKGALGAARRSTAKKKATAKVAKKKAIAKTER